MKFTLFRRDLPEWAKEAMIMTCPYCDSGILDNSDTGATTVRKCSNPWCPGHLSYRADKLAKHFSIKGLGPKTLSSEIKARKMRSHFEFIPLWFKGVKPVVTLPEIAVLACIEGYGAPSANKELSHYSSFSEYFSTCQIQNPLLVENKDLLLFAELYFTIKPPMSVIKMYVMGTGSFTNYSSRDEFFRLINDAYGMYINVIQTGKRKTGISYLIKEHNAVDHSKSVLARECGIPIVTPAEFISILHSMCPYIDEG